MFIERSFFTVTTPLTSRQQRVLDFIRRSIADGSPPTRSEIALAFGLASANSAEQYLRALEQKGYIELSARARGITLTPGSGLPRMRSVPLIGRVAAGRPLLATEHIEEQVAVAPHWFAQIPDFLLQVRGDSMRDAHILDGDWLAVRALPSAENGQIVVARLDDEATVKRYRRQDNVVTLLPAHPDYQPIVVDLAEQSLVIEGIALGVIGRRL